MKKELIVLLLAVSVAGYSQKVKLVEGDLKTLKGLSSINTEFVYTDMAVGDKSEEVYLKEKKEAYNDKEAGRGDHWEKAWYADRTGRFEPNFDKLFVKYSGLTTKNKNAKYTLIFHTTRTEPGWNVGVMKSAARIDAVVLIVETSNQNNIIAKITVTNAPGRSGYDFDTGTRIEEAYAKSGKEIGKVFKSELGK